MLLAMATQYDEEDYYIPLVDQRVFGAGIKRKRVAFVPAASPSDSAVTSATASSNGGSRYLSIVMQKKTEETKAYTADEHSRSEISKSSATPRCEVCGHAIEAGNDNVAHKASIAHQLCEVHSHPPSHLDRSRAGLKYLQEYGWDPDSRRGLGARQEGIAVPVKAKEKYDTAGLGLLGQDLDEDLLVKQKGKHKPDGKQAIKLNAKEVRRIEEEKSKRTEKLRRSVYGDDLSQYLGPND